MKLLNTLLTALLITLLPSLGWTTALDDLVFRDGLYYPKFSDVPFTGEVTGRGKGYLQNGKEEGDWLWYHDNGQLKSRGTHKNGKKEGAYVSYYTTGNLDKKGIYKEGKEEGIWVSYWDNGQLGTKRNYKDGKKEGAWVSYWDNGQYVDTFITLS